MEWLTMLETVQAMSRKMGRGSLSERDDMRTKFLKLERSGRGVESFADRTDAIRIPIPGIEPGRRVPNVVKRCTDAVNADDLASDALKLLVKSYHRIDTLPVLRPDTSACERAVKSAYRFAMRTIHRERMNLAPPAWYYVCLMPAVPAQPERIEKHYGERPNVIKRARIVKGKIVNRDGGTVQEWEVTFPARPARPAYRTLRKIKPTDPDILILKRVCRGYAKPTKPQGNSAARETLENAQNQAIKLHPRTGTILRELGNPSIGSRVVKTIPVFVGDKYDGQRIVKAVGVEKTTNAMVAKSLGITVRTVQRAIKEVQPYVRADMGRIQGDPLPDCLPSQIRLNCTNPVLVGTYRSVRIDRLEDGIVRPEWVHTIARPPVAPTMPRQAKLSDLVRAALVLVETAIELLQPTTAPTTAPATAPDVSTLSAWREENYRLWRDERKEGWLAGGVKHDNHETV